MVGEVCRIDGDVVCLPIGDGPLYREAYHGTSRHAAESIVACGFELGRGYYGPAVYFWTEHYRAAIWWARYHQGFVSSWAVIQAEVDSGRTLYLDQVMEDDLVKSEAERLAREQQDLPPGWTSRHPISLAALAVLHSCARCRIVVHTLHATCSWGPEDKKRRTGVLCVYDRHRIRGRRLLECCDFPAQIEEAHAPWATN